MVCVFQSRFKYHFIFLAFVYKIIFTHLLTSKLNPFRKSLSLWTLTGLDLAYSVKGVIENSYR